jgi:hypothetical protein
MGEIQLKSVTGSLSRPAAFYVPQEVAAPRGSEVLIIELKERVCYVIPVAHKMLLVDLTNL